MSFEEGLAQCVDWYQKYPTWGGDIANILTPFPELSSKAVGPGLLEAAFPESEAGNASLQAEIGAEPYDPASGGGKKFKGTPASNGLVFKKRKADDALEEG